VMYGYVGDGFPGSNPRMYTGPHVVTAVTANSESDYDVTWEPAIADDPEGTIGWRGYYFYHRLFPSVEDEEFGVDALVAGVRGLYTREVRPPTSINSNNLAAASITTGNQYLLNLPSIWLHELHLYNQTEQPLVFRVDSSYDIKIPAGEKDTFDYWSNGSLRSISAEVTVRYDDAPPQVGQAQAVALTGG